MNDAPLLPLLAILPALLGGCAGLRVVPMVLPSVTTVIAVSAISGELSTQETPVAKEAVVEPLGDFEQVDLNQPGFQATPASDLQPFSQATARSALEVDVSACRARGLPGGYGAATITFEPSGTVSRVTLCQPMSEDAQLCMRDAFDVTIPPFSGGAVDVPTRYYAR